MESFSKSHSQIKLDTRTEQIKHTVCFHLKCFSEKTVIFIDKHHVNLIKTWKKLCISISFTDCSYSG